MSGRKLADILPDVAAELAGELVKQLAEHIATCSADEPEPASMHISTTLTAPNGQVLSITLVLLRLPVPGDAPGPDAEDELPDGPATGSNPGRLH